MDISPKFLMKLIDQIEEVLWKEFVGYQKVEFYFAKWQTFGYSCEPNFRIYYKTNNPEQISSKKTLNNIDSETLIKIAVDLGIETPYFIPSIPLIKNNLKTSYSTAFDSFDKAIKQIQENPDIAIELANSTLESIVKHILNDDEIGEKLNKNDTLHKLTQSLLREFRFKNKEELPEEIKTIGNGLLNVLTSIEDLRSRKTHVHGKLAEDYLIKDSMYAYFIINVVSSIGLFLINFYEKKYQKNKAQTVEETNEIIPEEMPF